MATPTKTPLRYPGGKARLTPFIKEVIATNSMKKVHYVEPYAGGAGAALELLFSGAVSSIHLNDSSRAIYAFWYSVLNRTEELCRMITRASLTIEEWRYRQQVLKHPNKHSLLELGFSTFFLNRCNRSGILSGGVIGGVDQTGNYKMDARFSRTALKQRILAISSFKSKIKISNLDAEHFLITNDARFPENTLIYLDPPYYIKGSELYLNFYKKDDHARIANLIQQGIETKWILSYDAAEPVIELYSDRNYFLYDLQYNAGKVYKGREIFIFSDKVEIPESSSLKYIDVALKYA